MSVSAQTRGKALTVRCVREKVVNVCWPTSIFSVDRFFLVHSISHKPRPKLIIPCARGTRLCPGHSVPRVMSEGGEGVVLWCTAMSGVMIYPIPSMSQCECYCPWNASQCVSYALLSPTRYKT